MTHLWIEQNIYYRIPDNRTLCKEQRQSTADWRHNGDSDQFEETNHSIGSPTEAKGEDHQQ